MRKVTPSFVNTNEPGDMISCRSQSKSDFDGARTRFAGFTPAWLDFCTHLARSSINEVEKVALQPHLSVQRIDMHVSR